MFAPFHYLSADINKASRCFVAAWGEVIVGFSATLPFPTGSLRNAWRGHRTVILPDYQGIGIGPRFSDAIAAIHVKEGRRYFSRTAHPRLGEYRNAMKHKWRETSSSQKTSTSPLSGVPLWEYDTKRVCYSHEYIEGQDPKILAGGIPKKAVSDQFDLI